MTALCWVTALRRSVQGALLGLCASACFGTPTPLAPQLRGSIGAPHDGVQTDGVELPKHGPGFVRFRPHGSAYWGQPELVRALVDLAAADAQEFGGPPLVLGDLSARHGGKIPRHNSHRTGRDVDLLWHLLTPAGEPRTTRGFLHVGPDGLARDPASGEWYRLHVERQWATVKALLESEHIEVQWIFCSRPIEALLIDYARARGEPNELVHRAQTVLLQPRDSLPHDDHLHVRISCTPETALTGCSGGGPYWDWLPELPSLVLEARDWEQIGAQDPLRLEPEPDTSSG